MVLGGRLCFGVGAFRASPLFRDLAGDFHLNYLSIVSYRWLLPSSTHRYYTLLLMVRIVIMKLLLSSSPGLLAQLLFLISAFPFGASFTAVFHDAAATMSPSVFSMHPRARGPPPRLFVVSSVADVDNDGVDDVDSVPTEAISPPAAVSTSKMTSDLKALLPKQKMRFMKVRSCEGARKRKC